MKNNTILKNLKLNKKNLIQFGFILENNYYIYETKLMDNQFKLIIKISNNNELIYDVIDLSTNEKYLPFYTINQKGKYSGAIKEIFDNILDDILINCFEKEVFKSSQTKRIIKYIKEKYNDNLEFLWKKSPNNAIVRNKENNKWYCVILTIDKNKLGIKSNDTIEIIDLLNKKEEIEKLVDNKKYFPGYHMNKKSWFTIILDDTLPDQEIINYIDNSHKFVETSNEWIIPANPKYYDIIEHFNNFNTITWKKPNNIKVGSTVYIYMSKPYASILYKCKVININDKHQPNTMDLKLIENYDTNKYSLEKLKSYGISAIRSPRRLSNKLNDLEKLSEINK